MTEAFIFDAIRTPRGKGKKDGSLHEVKPISLVTGLLSALQERNQIDTAGVDDVILGCVSPIGEQGGNIAKTAVMAADWHESVSGFQLNRFCASGLEAVNLGAMKIRSDWENLVVAGGVESMSRVPMGSDGGAWALDPATNLHTQFVPQGISADLIATVEGFSREDVDQFALQSQIKATRAREAGFFKQAVVPVKDSVGLTVLDHDEFIRPETTLDGLGALRSSFDVMGSMGFDNVALAKYYDIERINHVHTAGNSSGIVDGSALILLGNEASAKKYDLTPRARVVAAAVTSTDPTIMLTGPGPATRKVLEKANMAVDQIDLFEVNEAFAAVVLRFMKEMHVDPQKVNVNGGSIALGHPLGATGAIILGALLEELERRQLRYGLATLCVGGGMGVATIIERL